MVDRPFELAASACVPCRGVSRPKRPVSIGELSILRTDPFSGLLLKDSYWRWPERNLSGNTIDFFVQVLGLSFHQAMGQITAQ